MTETATVALRHRSSGRHRPSLPPVPPIAHGSARPESARIAADGRSIVIESTRRREETPPQRSSTARPRPERRNLESRGGGGRAAIDRHDDRVSGHRVAPREDEQVARGRESRVKTARERRVRAPDRDQLRVVGAQRLVPRLAGAGQDRPVAPRHVAPVVGPIAPNPPDLVPPADHRNPGAGELQNRREPESLESPPRKRERAGHVVARRGSARAGGPDGSSRATSGTDRTRPSARVPAESRPCFPGSRSRNRRPSRRRRTTGRAPAGRRPRPRPGGRSPSPSRSRVRRRCSFQNGWSMCLTVSRRKPSTPARFASPRWASMRNVSTSGNSVFQSGRPETQRVRSSCPQVPVSLERSQPFVFGSVR